MDPRMMRRGFGPGMRGMGPAGRPMGMRGMGGMGPMRGPANGMMAGRGMAPPATGAARGGGLLSRLLNRGGGQSAAVQGFTRAAGAGEAVQGLMGTEKLSSFLGQTQEVLRTVQQFGPVMQQYGPLVKNIPSMWKIYRGLQSSGEEQPAGGAEKAEAAVETKKPVSAEGEETTARKTDRSRAKKSGDSVPKLFFE